MADGYRRRGRSSMGSGPRGRHGGRGNGAGPDVGPGAAPAVGPQGAGRPDDGPDAWDGPADNPRGRVHSWDSYRAPRQFDGRTQDQDPDRDPGAYWSPEPGPDSNPHSDSDSDSDSGRGWGPELDPAHGDDVDRPGVPAPSGPDTFPGIAPGAIPAQDADAGSPPWRRTVRAGGDPDGRAPQSPRNPRNPRNPRGPRGPRSPLISAVTVERPRPAGTRGAIFAGRVLLGATSAAVILASGLTWAAYHDLTAGLLTSSALSTLKPGEKGYVKPRLDGSVNLLLIGLDSRKDMNGDDLPTQFVEDELHAGSSDIGGYNTNVLIFMHIPADGGRVTAFSIARDDFVEEPGGDSSVGPIPDLGTHKIKEAYGRAKAIAERRLRARGETDKARIEAESREVGRESTIRAVQLLTGERVDHFAEINLLGFYDIAQAVGPIQVCLNHPVSDPIENGAGTGLQLPAGYSDLDAAQALQFVRQRFHLPRGDFDRNRRQQAFLSAVAAKLRDEGVLGDLGRMQALMDVVKKDIVIDDGWDVLDFAQRAQNLTGGDAVFNELPITGQPVLPDDGSVNTVDPARIRRIVMTAFGDGALLASQDAAAAQASGAAGSGPSAQSADPADGVASSAAPDAAASSSAAQPADPAGPAQGVSSAQVQHDAVVDVYNASGRTGQAAAAAGLLNAAGWPVSGVMNAPVQAQSTVYYGPGAEDEAGRLAAKLGLTAAPEPSTRASAQRVIIYLGTDYTPAGGVTGAGAGGGSAGPSGGVDGGDGTAASDGPNGSTGSTGSNDSTDAGSPGDAGTAGPSGPAARSAPLSGGIAMSDGVTCVN